METPAQRCARIVTALEDLVEQEAAALAQRDFASLLALQERTQPLIDFVLSVGAPVVKMAGLRKRLVALHNRRRQTSEVLAAELERTRLELEQTEIKQRRVARITPVYGRATVVQPRLQAVG